MILVYNRSAFKHQYTERDIETALATALIDELMEGFENKYLAVGFDPKGNFLEVMYNLAGEDIANIFHAMRPSRESLRKLQERGYYADFD